MEPSAAEKTSPEEPGKAEKDLSISATGKTGKVARPGAWADPASMNERAPEKKHNKPAEIKARNTTDKQRENYINPQKQEI